MKIKDVRIRDGRPDEHASISDVTAAAFAAMEISNPTASDSGLKPAG